MKPGAIWDRDRLMVNPRTAENYFEFPRTVKLCTD